MTQPRNAFTKEQLLEIVEQMEMLENSKTKNITALDIQFTPNNRGRVSFTGEKEIIFTPSHIPDSRGYLDR